jgi:hypothetical protein
LAVAAAASAETVESCWRASALKAAAADKVAWWSDSSWARRPARVSFSAANLAIDSAVVRAVFAICSAVRIFSAVSASTWASVLAWAAAWAAAAAAEAAAWAEAVASCARTSASWVVAVRAAVSAATAP